MTAIIAGVVAFFIGFALAFILGKPQAPQKAGGILGLVQGVTGIKI